MFSKTEREKQHRLDRPNYLGQVRASFTACLIDRKALFVQHHVVSDFISHLGWARARNSCTVLLYCFMPEHVHIILQGNDEQADIYKTMVDFKQQTGFYLGKHSLPYRWQKGFYDRVIRSDRELAEQLRYIAENPVRRGLVEHWQQYPFTGSLGIDIATVFDALL